MIRDSKFVRVLVDTGPLVAIVNPADPQHARCVETLALIRPPLLTCWPVLAEAAWLLRGSPRAIGKLFKSAEENLFELLDIGQAALAEIHQLYSRYQSLGPDLADLALVHLAQRRGLNTVFTLDRRDFSVYRWKGRTPFHLLPELE